MKKLLVACGLLSVMACGRPEAPQNSELRFDIEVPKEEVDPQDLNELASALDAFMVEGKSQVDIQEVAAKVEVTGDFKPIFDELMASRDPLVDLECQNRKCVAISSGEAFSFKPPVELPVVGTPTILLSEQIDIHFELSEDLQRLEVCRINGLKVKVGFIKQNVDGALIELDADIVKTLFVDVGTAGSYPTDSCSF